jgi:hypothetical protein
MLGSKQPPTPPPRGFFYPRGQFRRQQPETPPFSDLTVCVSFQGLHESQRRLSLPPLRCAHLPSFLPRDFVPDFLDLKLHIIDASLSFLGVGKGITENILHEL